MELELKHIVGYLPYGLKWNLPLTSERYESILENECYGIIELAWAIENNYPNAEDYLNMTFIQPNPFIAIEDDVLFLGQMKCSLGWEEDDVYLSEMKPILRPLSDLTKEIDVNGEKFVPIVELSGYKDIKGELFKGYEHKRFYVKLRPESINEWLCHTIPSDTNSMDYFTIQKLYEWHFDIHGLIEYGLAIDINTLNK